MLLKIFVGTGLALSVLAAVVATRPTAFRVARSTIIGAAPEHAFALVNDFHSWPSWSPYEKLDPGMTKSFEGPRAGGYSATAGDDLQEFERAAGLTQNARQRERLLARAAACRRGGAC